MEDFGVRTNSFPDLYQSVPAPLPAQMPAMIWTRTDMLEQVWGVLQAVASWPHIIITPQPGGICLQLDGVLLGQLRWNGRVVLPFGRRMRERLLAEHMAMRDPDHVENERLVFDVHTMEDVDHAVWLLRFAYLGLNSQKDANLANGVSPCI